MRFVAGQGAVAESHRKNLLARALQRSTIGKQPLPERKEEPLPERKEEPLLERGDTAGKENHCRKGEPLPER